MSSRVSSGFLRVWWSYWWPLEHLTVGREIDDWIVAYAVVHNKLPVFEWQHWSKFQDIYSYKISLVSYYDIFEFILDYCA